jgi:hypothetical protein
MATTDEINALYQQILGRSADTSGLGTFANYDPTSLQHALSTSSEYQNKNQPYLKPGQDATGKFTSGAIYYQSQGWIPGGSSYEGVPTQYTNPKTGETVFFGNMGGPNKTETYNWVTQDQMKPYQEIDPATGKPLYINARYQAGDQNEPMRDANGELVRDAEGNVMMQTQYTTEKDGNQAYMNTPKAVLAHEAPKNTDLMDALKGVGFVAGTIGGAALLGPALGAAGAAEGAGAAGLAGTAAAEGAGGWSALEAANFMGAGLSDAGAASMLGGTLSDTALAAQALGYTTAEDAIAAGLMTEAGTTTPLGAERIASMAQPSGITGSEALKYARMANSARGIASTLTGGSGNSGSGLGGLLAPAAAAALAAGLAKQDSSGNVTAPGLQSLAAPKKLDWGYQAPVMEDPYVAQGQRMLNPTYMAKGGLSELSQNPSQGISSLGGYSDGGRMLKGPGDGMSDSIPASIENKRPARLATDEFVVPADVVSHLGNGSSDAGAKVLYAMMDRIRHARTGNKKQGKQINPNKFMPA